MRVTVIPIVVSALGTVSKSLVKKSGRIGNQWKNQDHSDYSIVKTNLNTQKSLRDVMGLAVTQTTVKDHQLILVG